MRLSRAGSKRRPYYKIVVVKESARSDRFIEKIGTYNPLLPKDDAKAININAERAKHWLRAGAQPTERVLRFLEAARGFEQVNRGNSEKNELVEKASTRVEQYIKNLDQKEAVPVLEESYLIKVNLFIDDNEALDRLTESVQNFMRFLGYTTNTEPEAEEPAIEVSAEIREQGGSIEC